MTTKTKATARPWELDDNFINKKGKKICIAEVYSRDCYDPAGEYKIPSAEEGKANARLIVHCVNQHDALIECLIALVEHSDYDEYLRPHQAKWIREARKLIAESEATQ